MGQISADEPEHETPLDADVTARWQARRAAEIGASVAYWRKKSGVKSARDLAALCRDHGNPIARNTIAKLEAAGTKWEHSRRTGEPFEPSVVARPFVTDDELLTLAQALDIPEIVLRIPLGRADTVEIAPGREVSPIEAYNWMIGQRPLVYAGPRHMQAEERSDTYLAASQAIGLLQRHWSELSAWEGTRRQLTRAVDSGDNQAAHEALVSLGVRSTIIGSTRKDLRAGGFVLPGVPDELAHELGESE